MIFLKILGKLIKVLRSNASPGQIAWGFALGTFLGFTPLVSLHNLGIVFLICILNVNITGVFFGWLVSGLLSFFLDPLFHSIGFSILVQIGFLKSFWTALYNAPIAPLTRFNNTIVMGSFVFSLIAFVPAYLLFRNLVVVYRSSWNEKLQKVKFFQIFKGSKLVKLYFKVRKLGE
jgi:uncharacterized protein (TIGR03546 family)